MDEGVKRRLQDILLHVADDEEGRQILKGMMIDSFVTGDDRNYDTIRGMNRWLLKQGKQP
jgi:phosphonate transport system substrate-binding protein